MYSAFKSVAEKIMSHLGVELNLENNVGFKFKLLSGVEVVIEMLNFQDGFSVVSVLGDLPHYDDGCLLEMLKWNNFPHESGILALNKSSNNVILNFCSSFEDFDVDEFFEKIKHFESRALLWTESLKFGQFPVLNNK